MSGTTDERFLARIFDQASYFVQRGASSGSGNYRGIDYPGPGDDRCQPDVLAAGHGDVFLMELKAGVPPFYFDDEEVAQLKWAAQQIDAHALLVGRVKGDPSFRFYDPDDQHTTDAGNRRVKVDDDPLTRLQDPRSEADDPPGYHWKAVEHHGLGKLLRADEDDDIQPGDVDE